ncbi:glycosyltransferase family 4 protein [Sediminivirga luteola]|uniref:glycosyltransferase family 4 protein n=1 Tax=Sediminivirga luteola TaxID=1774748 RepID=UPI001F55CDE7|nr:glycosyltransferase family 4 protein [Sediminivirga luteola]MCI2266955.1 glycosyltransferase family 4 protein [Sediminivirga luteola]
MRDEERAEVGDGEGSPGAVKTVWIVNHYAALTSKDGWAGRHQALAERLSEHGWQAILLLASTSHPDGVQHLQTRRLRSFGIENDVKHVMYTAPAYTGNGVGRIVNMLAFTANVLRPGGTDRLPRPDVVIGSTVHPAAAYAGWRLAKRHRVPFVFEIRDVWPDALVHLGQLTAGSVPARAMTRLMRTLTRHADLVLSPLPAIDQYVASLGYRTPVMWLANGTDGDMLEAGPEPQDWPEEAAGARPFTFMYLGSLGKAMDLETIMGAFVRAKASCPDIPMELRVVGSGARKAELVRFAEALGADARISFEDRVPRTEVLRKAAEADCLVHALHDHPVYAYGVSPNKIFDYLLAARPIVFAAHAPRNPVSEAQAGEVVSPEDMDAMAAAMRRVAHLAPPQRARMGAAGRRLAIGEYSYRALAARFADRLDAMLNESRV